MKIGSNKVKIKMKRYDIHGQEKFNSYTGDPAGYEDIEINEDPNGDWVLYEDIVKNTHENMVLPKYLYRQDDGEAFILVNGLYYLEASLLSFPDNLHTGYSYKHLKSVGFQDSPPSIHTDKKTREQHIAEFWQSFYISIDKAGGSIRSFNTKMTLQELADTLAQNGIRFVNV